MTPKLLNPEELDVQFYAHQWGNMAQSHAAKLALRAHIAALEADHAKALVRARNEGLERAARLAESIGANAQDDIRAMKENEQ